MRRIQLNPAPVLARALLRGLLLLLLCAASPSIAQPARAQVVGTATNSAQDDSIALQQALLDLSNPWTVMCVAAHPDDEDGATLTVLRRKYGVHTVTVFSTYGEGGQNAIGPELYEELGAIRARETLAAALIQGSEPWFLSLRDFGFSKSADEAFRIWNHDEALRRMVLKIRTLHPDVIITNHDTVSGHGHHQATGRLVLEAFDAASDPSRFPEQLREPGVTLWQAKRLFVRINYEGGTGSKTLEDEAERAGRIVSISPNERDSVRGTTYAEQALQALHQHASQGPWPATVPKEGAPVIRYRLAREAKDAAPFPANAQTFLEGLQLPQAIKSRLPPATIDGQPLTVFTKQRERVFDVLVAAREASQLTGDFTESNEEPHLRLMNERLNRALAALSGITLNLASQDAVLIPNSRASFLLNITNNGDREAIIQSVYFKGGDSGKHLKAASRLAPKTTIVVPAKTFTWLDAAINVPRAEHLYDGRLFGQQFYAIAHIVVNGKGFLLPATTRVDVAPLIGIASIAPSPYIFTPATLNQPLTFRIRLVNHQDKPFKGEFGIASPSEHINEVGPDITLAANESREFTVRTNVIPVDTPDERRTPRADFGNIIFSVHPPESINIITQRETRVIYSDARVAPTLRVGYVRSFDDTLRDALNALGVEARELTIDDVRAGELKSFDTIIIDNRGYQAHPELVAANARLLEYVRAGGTLVVFYHKTGEWNPDAKKNRPQLAPYPIILNSERVTDETAPITFTEPQSALLNFPNKITAEDFAGWIQERGLYYPKEWDAHYSAPLAMSDAGEAPLRGGLLAADYGRGRYIYTSLVWYRQLRAGVPGAYRVFANMISYGHAGERARNTASSR
jgi:LmbE family N-acetylglucosaminyl deacetylase